MKQLFLLLVMGMLVTTNVQAILISGPDIISAPSSVIDDTPGATNDHQQAFNEAHNVLLTDDLLVDGGMIAAGTRVDSHMIFLNTIGNAFATDTQDWMFDGLILGVMSDLHGLLEVVSSNVVGASGTVYPNSGFVARGLEGSDAVTISGNSINVRMSVSEPGDWIRIITETKVPEPTSFIIMLLGLLGLARIVKTR